MSLPHVITDGPVYVDAWIGVDLDGTLAEYNIGDIKQHGVTYIGPPIAAMTQRVKNWIMLGWKVKIFTARVAWQRGDDQSETNAIRKAIKVWCRLHIGLPLDITCQKDYHCVQIWDDRAITVEANTGRIITQTANDAQTI